MTLETRPPELYLTDKEALEYLGIKSADLERLLKEFGIGRYRTYVPGRPVVFAKRDLDRLKAVIPPPAPPKEAPAKEAAAAKAEAPAKAEAADRQDTPVSNQKGPGAAPPTSETTSPASAAKDEAEDSSSPDDESSP